MNRHAWTKTWEGYGTATGVDTPYVDFDSEVGGISPFLRAPEKNFSKRGGSFTAPFAMRQLSAVKAGAADTPDPPYNDPLLEVLKQILSIQGANTVQPPLPTEMVTGGNDPAIHQQYLRDFGPLPAFLQPDCDTDLPESMCLPDDAVIVGVVDLGIALGHRRTQLNGAKTRILSAWQQSANRSDKDGEQQYLPFGRELYADCINAELADCGVPLNEEKFNRFTQTEDYYSLSGQRELGQRASHGMHILDLAAGLDPDDECDLADKVRLMVTNFPDRALVGHSAAFLEYFAVYGIWRMIRLADAIWDRRNKNNKVHTDLKGYRMVINLSFGKQASGRDKNDLIAKAMEMINCARAEYHPVILSLPAGNENLEQGNSLFSLAGGAMEDIEWRIPPGDQSANFVEVWAQSKQGASNQSLEIEVITPDGETSKLSQGASRSANSLYIQQKEQPNGFQILPEQGELIARIYSDHIDAKGHTRGRNQLDTEDHADLHETEYRQRYVVAVKQTLIYDNMPGGTSSIQTAPAGVWTIRVRNNGKTKLNVELNVQTDQSENPVTAINQRSYFEHSHYRRFDETGRKVDTYDYPKRGQVPKSLDSSNVVRRHGTLNAVGISNSTATVAGHRGTDGRPESYSSTGLASPRRKRREEPSASFPSRDGAAHFGVLASGSRDGSSAALQGTSFSAAMATRHLWGILVNHAGFLPPKAVIELENNAETEETFTKYEGAIAKPKSGHGRLPHTPQATQLKRRNLASRLGTE